MRRETLRRSGGVAAGVSAAYDALQGRQTAHLLAPGTVGAPRGYEWAQYSEGTYILRTNITDWPPEALWTAYVQLTEAEAAFRIHKSDLAIRPIRHQKASRIKAHVYVISAVGDSLAVFSRDPASGRLAFVEVHRDGVGGVDGLADARQLATSADGGHLCVASALASAVVVFTRDTATGELTFVQAVHDRLDGVLGLAGARGVV
ncbi:beta-propeller fold lactonase family protein, partial [Candidatus Binatia bacterium]|nr:beta-propeller fold lactonase family protein [Candidatus Binatia bacterium]